MKVSEFLRQYQLTGKVPEEPKGDPLVSFWAGWLMGRSKVARAVEGPHDLETAIRAAEFIEERSKT